MNSFEINIDGSVFPIIHNIQGDRTYLNCPKRVDNIVMNLEVWLADMQIPPNNSLIRVIKGHLDMREDKATQVLHRYTKRWSKHFKTRLYIQEYEIIGQNTEIITEVKDVSRD